VNGADFLNAMGVKPRVKVVHMGKFISSEGDVSPLCAQSPRAINLKKAPWTNRAEAVTCRRCKNLIPDPDKPAKVEP